jgi:catechol 2,3-dioxygenase-like lactoylglutathione lyase family enzyme
MRVMPIRYVRDMEAFERFYRALGLAPDARQRDGGWIELAGSAGVVALHAWDGEPAPPELAFVSDEPLETVAASLAAAGFPVEALVDEAYGRSLRVRDPEGVLVVINEHNRSLYT